ncbi:MAG: hypothetical protein GY835_13945 [bacterium]|nr:hypothetical protein [bacterium]
MGFLNSLLLIGSLGALVPLIIHLLERRKVQKLEFPSLRFILELNRRRMRRLNLQRILLLLLRMLLIILIAFALARPTLLGGLARIFPESAPRATALLLDASASMNLETETGSLGDLARTRADEILAALDDRDEVLLYSVEERAFDLGGGPISPTLARELVGAWQPGSGTCALLGGAAEALTALAAMPQMQRELYLLSDFAEATLDDLGDVEIPEGLHAFALPLSENPPINAGITELRLPLRPVLPGRPFKLAVRGEQQGGETVEPFPVELELGGHHRGSLQLEPRAGNPDWRELSVSLEAEGFVQGVWRKKKDRFAGDDELFFTLPVTPRLGVLLLEPPEVAGSDEGRLSLSTHLARALDPYLGQRPEELSLRLENVAAARLNSSRLAGRHLALVAGGAGIDATRAELLADWVAAGGGLVICPDESGLGELARYLLPRVAGPRSLESVEGASGYLADFDPDHPLFAGFADEHRQVLTRQPLWRIFRTRPGDRDVLTRFRDGRPAMLGWRHGQGRVRLLLFEAGPEGGELPYSSMFLPLIQELTQEAAGTVAPQLVAVGEPLSWPLKDGGDGEYQVVGPDEQVLPVRIDTGAFPPRAVLDRTATAGFYTLQRRGAAGPVTIAMAAARVPADEGLLTPLAPDSLPGALGLPELAVIGRNDLLAPALHAGRFGKEITLPLLLMAALLMGIELWAGQRQTRDT